MAKAARHRNSLIQAAIRLFREQGYANTGLNQILTLSKAPKGSLYYYFPNGKEQLAQESIQLAGQVVEETLRELARVAETPADFITAYCELLAGWMADSQFKSGCPIATTVLETVPESARLTSACRNVFANWTALIAAFYEKAGCPRPEAELRAEFTITVVEGALLQARVQGSSGPIERAAKSLSAFLDCMPG